MNAWYIAVCDTNKHPLVYTVHTNNKTRKKTLKHRIHKAIQRTHRKIQVALNKREGAARNENENLCFFHRERGRLLNRVLFNGEKTPFLHLQSEIYLYLLNK